jgi:tetratricopeptide (TPR) repeat protein
MRKLTLLNILILSSIGCNNATEQTVNTNVSVQESNESAIVSSHSQSQTANVNDAAQMPTPVQKSETKTKWTQSGSPIDTSKFDAEIIAAEKDFKAKPKGEVAKKTLAESYLKRAVALTDARQYASALGDYRRVLKYDAENEEAKKWIEEIIKIYASINREYPKEGEEPPPIPFKKT